MMTPQDFERLSAYLDDQLSSAEKAKLEKRLAQEPELKAALADLRMTVRALRSLPSVKPPRNFTLSRAQALQRRGGGVVPLLRLATTFAALALVIVVAGDFLSLSASRNAMNAPAQVAERSTEAENATESAVAAGAPASADAQLATTPAGATMSALAADSATSTPEAESTGPFIAAPSQLTETPELTARFAVTLTETPTPTETAIAAAPEPQAQTPSGPPLIRYLEVGLAVLTMGLAFATWLWRRGG
ncbi:MAG: anti-sigma factor family protein [Anaerolineales bacterium]